MEANQKDILDRKEAAAFLRIGKNTLAAWACRRFGPPFVRVGRRIVYRRSDLNQWLDSHRCSPGDPHTGGREDAE